MFWSPKSPASFRSFSIHEAEIRKYAQSPLPLLLNTSTDANLPD
jgi:hypothetical protein